MLPRTSGRKRKPVRFFDYVTPDSDSEINDEQFEVKKEIDDDDDFEAAGIQKCEESAGIFSENQSLAIFEFILSQIRSENPERLGRVAKNRVNLGSKDFWKRCSKFVGGAKNPISCRANYHENIRKLHDLEFLTLLDKADLYFALSIRPEKSIKQTLIDEFELEFDQSGIVTGSLILHHWDEKHETSESEDVEGIQKGNSTKKTNKTAGRRRKNPENSRKKAEQSAESSSAEPRPNADLFPYLYRRELRKVRQNKINIKKKPVSEEFLKARREIDEKLEEYQARQLALNPPKPNPKEWKYDGPLRPIDYRFFEKSTEDVILTTSEVKTEEFEEPKPEKLILKSPKKVPKVVLPPRTWNPLPTVIPKRATPPPPYPGVSAIRKLYSNPSPVQYTSRFLNRGPAVDAKKLLSQTPGPSTPSPSSRPSAVVSTMAKYNNQVSREISNFSKIPKIEDFI
ncbi:Protein CBG20133 [Caenorhabditis briggsae]|uniref:Protein CBG20133 n=1 Tax=Caenorhabditis briggsae TaxID=6238 RepID=A8XX55_CAEBR|nr:Protein CBG20133 [Caenorhabditis briggsae]CAP37224.1 Protein CBG20133 [Caenorhabditis briggsae]